MMDAQLLILAALALGLIVGGIVNFVIASKQERDNAATERARRKMLSDWGMG